MRMHRFLSSNIGACVQNGDCPSIHLVTPGRFGRSRVCAAAHQPLAPELELLRVAFKVAAPVYNNRNDRSLVSSSSDPHAIRTAQ
ncbi:hypothetical protein EXIGLDRAFT_354011 [Exidia glandulosa HHB12029]|uniref:Uncharacterized protein n=1 Tax=Exidia glandulosa HHB12029 TaxID=1314781 RepID=A0A165LDB9_EXIGL|nr:hypothetical protein EXIGLDRAFT_354011 [Exidia glandulosa HHB12029]